MFSFCDHAKKKRYLGFKPVAALLIYGQVKAGEGRGGEGGMVVNKLSYLKRENLETPYRNKNLIYTRQKGGKSTPRYIL